MSHPEDVRRPFDELMVLYEVEPSLRDVVVEGASDAEVIESYLRRKGFPHVDVYPIDYRVELPPGTAANHGLHDGNRGRVIALSLAVEMQLSKGHAGPYPTLTCVADRDGDTIEGRVHRSRVLLFTDFADLLSFSFDAIIVGIFLKEHSQNYPMDGPSLCRQLFPILRELFVVRVILMRAGVVREGFIAPSRVCTRAETIGFDAADYIDRLFNKNAVAAEQRDSLISACQEAQSSALGDERLYVRGHDFAHMLTWALRKHASSAPWNLETVESRLLGLLDCSCLDITTLFSRLCARVALHDD